MTKLIGELALNNYRPVTKSHYADILQGTLPKHQHQLAKKNPIFSKTPPDGYFFSESLSVVIV